MSLLDHADILAFILMLSYKLVEIMVYVMVEFSYKFYIHVQAL